MLEREREHVAGLGAGRQERPREIEGLAVVGHEDGDLLSLCLRNGRGIDGWTRRFAPLARRAHLMTMGRSATWVGLASAERRSPRRWL